MRHLRIYEDIYYNEENNLSYKKGDFIVLLVRDRNYVPDDFIIGNVYKIRDVDASDLRLPYEICINDKKNSNTAWVYPTHIRLAESWEIDQNKYNL